MSKISHTEPSQHCNISHWIHMEEMKWFSSAMLGVLAANNLGIGLVLAEIYQTLEVREMVDVRQFCSERLEFCKWLLFCNLVFFQNPSQMAGILQTAIFLGIL